MLFTPINPMLPNMHMEAFDDPNYIFEPKWDGWRILLHKQGDRVEGFTRNGRIVTDRFPELREVASAIRAYSAVLDCEGICLRDGRSVFDDFQYRGRIQDPRRIHRAMQTHPVTFVAFDVLYTDRSHMNEPLLYRKQRLFDLVQSSHILTPTMFVDGAGIKMKRLTEQRNWEGIVAKRKDSLYIPDTRTTNWLKIKNWKEIDAVILGYRREPQFGLVVGLHFPTVRNKPVAVVEYGFKAEEKTAFLEVAKEIHTAKDRDVQWIAPVLCCKIQYLERTERHHLRTVAFRGFVPGKDPAECRWIS
ncbi:hypothetical protein [Alicyclobacillus macrosporangiidus]|uniref:Bifunctional non-homologous end joining protein LigD n=1 Tax=Alicyclobacillus macrosporangiidus TaxID=392015 RepID=A0A1I7KBR1_9BACL|nr:hypothetical protein [Alicyclobacillus macrosporangiidus]SFU94855.1 bifunctional non-homologous end joining protein LigD [Alicyclobacillus macrosporangiidus]